MEEWALVEADDVAEEAEEALEDVKEEDVKEEEISD
jgi:hypothetical protein